MTEPHRHLRLVFGYEAGTLRLLGQFRCSRAVSRPPTEALTVLETRDAAGRTLARMPRSIVAQAAIGNWVEGVRREAIIP